MLLGNGSIVNKLPLMYYCGVMCNTNWNRDEIILGLGSFDLKASAPDGYGISGYEKAIRAGNISAKENIAFSASGSGAMGVNGEGSSGFSIDFAGADGGMIVSGGGESLITISASSSVVASLSASGSTTFTISMNHLAMYVDAYGWASAQLDMVTSGSGTLSAIAIMGGTTVDTSGLTPASIWNYQDRTLTALDVEVSGLTVEQANQLNDIANNAGLIPALL